MYNVSDVVSNSLKLAWKHKILWIFALFIGASGFNGSGGGSGSSNTSRNSDTNTIREEQELKYDEVYDSEYPAPNVKPVNDVSPKSLEELITLVREKLSSSTNSSLVLGVSEDRVSIPTQPLPINPVSRDTLLTQVLSLGRYHFALLILVFVAFIFFAVALGMIIRSWALGALLGGINEALMDSPYTLRQLGTFGRISMKELVKYRIFVGLVGLGVLLPLLGVPLFLSFISPYFFILFIIAFPVLIVFIITLSFTDKFAIRFISLKHYNYMDSLQNGFHLLKVNLIKIFVLAISNCFVQTAFMILIFIIVVLLAALFIIPAIALDVPKVFSEPNASLVSLFVAFAAPVLIALVTFFTLFNGFKVTYENFTWSTLFNFAVNEEGYKIKDSLGTPASPSQSNVVQGGPNG